MRFLKRVSASVLAGLLVLNMTACGEDTSYIGTVDGEEVSAGVYIYGQYQAMSNAYYSEEFDSELEDIWENVIEEQMLEAWINSEAITDIKQIYEARNQLEEYGLELSQDDLDAIDYTVESNWDYYCESFEEMGVSKDSYEESVISMYELYCLFDYVYGTGGPLEVTDEELETYFETDYANFKQIEFSFVDDSGEELSTEEKELMKETAQEYLEKAEEDIETFDDLIQEYTDSLKTIEELAEEAAAEEEETDEEESEYDENMIMVQKDEDSYYVSTKLSQAIFEDSEIGEPILLSDDTSYYVILRYDVMPDAETYENYKTSLLYNLKSEEFLTTIEEEAIANIEIELNEKSINRYSPKNIVD